jgi:hypothetical protein
MVFFVPESEATQDLIVGAGSDCLFSVVPQENPQVTACWAVGRGEIRSGQALGGGHSITPATHKTSLDLLILLLTARLPSHHRYNVSEFRSRVGAEALSRRSAST